MTHRLRVYLAAGGLLVALLVAAAAFAQKPGGVLHMPIGNSPASMSIHEEATRIAVTPMMAVFNNLVLFDQHVAQNTFESIRPDLAESWSWDEDKTALTFRLRTGAKGTTARRSRRKTSNAPGTRWPAGPARNCGSIRARAGTATWPRSR